jgi:ADP-ribose pyrophosphatase YjhB (NUDIX family)
MEKKKFCPFCGTRLTTRDLEGSLRLFCEHCNEAIYENPIPATCIVVVDDSERVILVKRSVPPKEGFWCLPGGFMELGETPEQAALRELEEETGLCGRIDGLLGVTVNPSTQYDTVLMVGYLVKEFTGNLKAGDDASDVAYFQSDKLPEIAFESHHKFIRDYYSASYPSQTGPLRLLSGGPLLKKSKHG